MCMIYDAEEWKVFHEEQRTAAKVHNCTECGRRIDRGERYFYSTGLIDACWYTHKICEHCDTCRQWLLVVCNGYLFCGVLEDLENHWEEWQLRSMWLGRRIVESRRRWRRKDGSLYPVTPPRKGIDYPRMVSIRDPFYYSGQVNEEFVEREDARLVLAVMKALWWGEWLLLENLNRLAYAHRQLDRRAA